MLGFMTLYSNSLSLTFSMVGEGVTPSTANPEPYVKVSPHTALQCMVICD